MFILKAVLSFRVGHSTDYIQTTTIFTVIDFKMQTTVHINIS